MPSKGIAILLGVIAVLGAANAVVFVQGRRVEALVAQGPVTAWRRWQAFSTAERCAYVARYQAIARRVDARAVFRGARQFAAGAPARQDYLRELERVIQSTLESQPVARRRDLLRDAPRARAFFVYEALATGNPRRLAELAAHEHGLREE